MWLLAVHSGFCSDGVLADAKKIIREIVCHRALQPPVSVEECILKPGDVGFSEKYRRRQDDSQRRGCAAQPRRGCAAREGKWQLQAQETRMEFAKRGGPAFLTARPWSQPSHDAGMAPAFLGFSPTAREMELADLAFLQRCLDKGVSPATAASVLTEREKLCQGLFVDMHENPHRRPWSVGQLRTCTTATRVYSFQEDAIVEPEEMHLLLGRLPIGAEKPDVPPPLSRSNMRTLVGGCMAVPPISAILHALIIAAGPHLPRMWK